MSGDDTPDSLLYEVSLRVARSVAVDYRRWLSSRVAAIARLRGVLGARVFEVGPGDADHCTLRLHLHVRDADTLGVYMAEHAPLIRAEWARRFPQQVEATRRLLHPLQLRAVQASSAAPAPAAVSPDAPEAADPADPADPARRGPSSRPG